jgi:hypothetical protein
MELPSEFQLDEDVILMLPCGECECMVWAVLFEDTEIFYDLILRVNDTTVTLKGVEPKLLKRK